MNLGAFMKRSVEQYYATRDPFGVEGDFTTAPEISQMFGEMIGIWIVDLWMQMGKPELDIIEFGPGRGTLMADIIRVTTKETTINFYFIENSPTLKEKQKTAVPQAIWVNTLNDIQSKNPCIIIGNEFLDALPIEQIKRNDKGWQKRRVLDESFDWEKAEDELLILLPQATQSNEIYEVAPERLSIIKQCQNYLTQRTGAALFIDYGHLKSHHGDTLQAIKNHEYVDPLKTAGDADLTAHVDFDALTRILELPNHLTTQRQFLLNLGIKHRAAALSKKKDVSADLLRLIAPDQMGELFKVLCFYKGESIKPAGF